MDYTANRINARDFTILPWGGMPLLDCPGAFWGSTDDVDSVMRDLWECGFNTTGFAPASYVPYAKKYGLSVILEDHRIGADIPKEEAEAASREFLAPYKDDPTVYGVCLRDEPNMKDFPNLGKWVKAVLDADPDKLPYINLFPNCVSVDQLGTPDYLEYVDKFVEICRPKFLSYDCYSLYEHRGLDINRFYSNLEIMRTKGIEHNLPFWHIILGNSHFYYLEPTQASIYVQGYSSLAYGVRGISYFTYYSPISGNYRLGGIDQFGNRTSTWEYVRMMNLQIHMLAPVYLTLKSINVFHHPDVPAVCRSIRHSMLLDEVHGKDLLVGEFEGPGGTPYAMVVNKSLTESTTLGITFKKKGTVRLTCAYTGKDMDFSGEHCWLAPGQGMLLHVGD
jgi:hypothetical protein